MTSGVEGQSEGGGAVGIEGDFVGAQLECVLGDLVKGGRCFLDFAGIFGGLLDGVGPPREHDGEALFFPEFANRRAGVPDAELLGGEFAGVGVFHPAEEGVAQFFDVFRRKIEQFRI